MPINSTWASCTKTDSNGMFVYISIIDHYYYYYYYYYWQWPWINYFHLIFLFFKHSRSNFLSIVFVSTNIFFVSLYQQSKTIAIKLRKTTMISKEKKLWIQLCKLSKWKTSKIVMATMVWCLTTQEKWIFSGHTENKTHIDIKYVQKATGDYCKIDLVAPNMCFDG